MGPRSVTLGKGVLTAGASVRGLGYEFLHSEAAHAPCLLEMVLHVDAPPPPPPAGVGRAALAGPQPVGPSPMPPCGHMGPHLRAYRPQGWADPRRTLGQGLGSVSGERAS